MYDWKREIKHDQGEIHQHVHTFSLGFFEGTFPEVLANLQKEYTKLKNEYVKNPVKVKMYDCNYADGTDTKTVQFNRLYIDQSESEGYKIYKVWAVRDLLPEEKTALQSEKDRYNIEQLERDRQELERLKKKLGEGV